MVLIGLQIAPEGGGAGEVTLEWLTWEGAPTVTFTRPDGNGDQWREAWVDGVNQFQSRWWDSFRISNNIGTGLISQGTADWQDYTASADISLMLARQGGLAVRVGGMRRWYALVLCDDGKVRLIKDREQVSVLAEEDFPVELDRDHRMELSVTGDTLTGSIDGKVVLEATDAVDPLAAGVGLVVGRHDFDRRRNGCAGRRVTARPEHQTKGCQLCDYANFHAWQLLAHFPAGSLIHADQSRRNPRKALRTGGMESCRSSRSSCHTLICRNVGNVVAEIARADQAEAVPCASGGCRALPRRPPGSRIAVLLSRRGHRIPRRSWRSGQASNT